MINDYFNCFQWLEKGVFAALAEEYLKTLTFAVYTKDSTGSDTLIETYSFSFEYSGNGPSKLVCFCLEMHESLLL